MRSVTVLKAYGDKRGNRIIFDGILDSEIKIRFHGSNNRLILDPTVKIAHLDINFEGDNGLVRLGANSTKVPFRAKMYVRNHAKILIGNDVTTTNTCVFTAGDRGLISVGNDCMIASGNAICADDRGSIFSVRTGRLLNGSKSIRIGNHVWLAREAAILRGVQIGDGSVIGHAGVVTRNIPTNSIAVGVPARVVKRDIAWERPGISKTKPAYKPDASTITKSPYWGRTRNGFFRLFHR